MTTKELSIADVFQALDEVAVFCPIPQVIHPLGAAELAAHGTRWCVDQGLCEPGSRASQMNLGLRSAAGAPHLSGAAAKALSISSGTLRSSTGEDNRVLFAPDAAPIPGNGWLGQRTHKQAKNGKNKDQTTKPRVDLAPPLQG